MSTKLRPSRFLSAMCVCALAWTAGLYAQDGAKQKDPQASEKTAEPEPPPRRPQPTLDELLGLDPAKPGAGEKKDQEQPPAAPDPSRTALERRLTAREVSEQFQQAVQLMGETADRLSVSRDTGIETQRLQSEIIRKLDMLIQSAEQQQQQQQRSRSSQRDGKSDQSENQPARPQPAPVPNQTSNPEEFRDPPAGTDPQLNPQIAARGAAWGNLPERVRDALLQGNADQYSSRYKAWTEAYYRRLAEEGNRR
jgi:hypothetical protein